MRDDWYLLFEFAVDVCCQTELVYLLQLDILGIDLHVQFGVVHHHFVNPVVVFVGEQLLIVFVVAGLDFTSIHSFSFGLFLL